MERHFNCSCCGSGNMEDSHTITFDFGNVEIETKLCNKCFIEIDDLHTLVYVKKINKYQSLEKWSKTKTRRTNDTNT